MMNKEINIEDLRPIAVVDYSTIDDIKEFVNLLLSLGGGSKTFDDYFEASLVHNGMAVAYYDDEDDYDDEDYDDEDYDDFLDEEEDEVETAIREDIETIISAGFVPQGGVSALITPEYTTCYSQAFFRKK